MATLDDSPSLYLGQQWTHWAEKVDGKSQNGSLNVTINPKSNTSVAGVT